MSFSRVSWNSGSRSHVKVCGFKLGRCRFAGNQIAGKVARLRNGRDPKEKKEVHLLNARYIFEQALPIIVWTVRCRVNAMWQ